MNKMRSSYFIAPYSIKNRLKRNILISLVFLFFVAIFLPFYSKTNCFLIKGADDKIFFIEQVKDKDEIVISHINSIYDARVEEVLMVEGETLLLKGIDTPSYGVKEYYGITSGFTPRRFSSITFRNTKDRGFFIKINGKKIEKIKDLVNMPVTFEIIQISTYEYYWLKLKI